MRINTLVFIWSIGLFPAALPAEVPPLPEMGDSSTNALPPEMQQRIGRSMWHRLYAAGKVIDDPELADYVQGLGYRLAASGDHPDQPFTFFLVDEPTVNAFALPGGYIGIHAGLVTATETEDELAAVVAHEVAHVTQNHLARGVEKAGEMDLPMTAALIAAILLGGQDPELAQAAIAATTAGALQNRIDFTRAHEKEADRLGIDMLASAGFDPHSMASFFRKLQQETRYYENDAFPEFLRTHPVNEARIADAQHRAGDYPPPTAGDRDGYEAARAKLAVMAANDPERLIARLEAQPHPDRYALALALAKGRHFDRARALLNGLIDEHPSRIAFRNALGSLELDAGGPQAAVSVFEDALKLYPGNPVLTLGLARSLFAGRRLPEARDELERLVRGEAEPPAAAWQLLSRAEAGLGRQAASRLALAEYYHSVGETHSAIDQLRDGLKQGDADFYLSSRMEARMEQFKREADLESTE